MSVILLLIAASLAMALLFLACFVWSVRSGQYEDTSTPALRVLADEASACALPSGPADSPAHGSSHRVPPATARAAAPGAHRLPGQPTSV
jgi:cbb3-type cytochrome oxidase maturation protein